MKCYPPLPRGSPLDLKRLFLRYRTHFYSFLRSNSQYNLNTSCIYTYYPSHIVSQLYLHIFTYYFIMSLCHVIVSYIITILIRIQLDNIYMKQLTTYTIAIAINICELVYNCEQSTIAQYYTTNIIN